MRNVLTTIMPFRNAGYPAARPTILGLTKALILCLLRFRSVAAAPLAGIFRLAEDDTDGDPSLWLYLSVAVVLVLLGGAFAGLTIA
jgi:metal transporter CNNM